MLETYASREQRIADMAIHGWVPAYWKPDGGGVGKAEGIWNDALGLGFFRTWVPADPRNHSSMTYGSACWAEVKLHNHLPVYWATSDWEQVSTDTLNAIEARLRQL